MQRLIFKAERRQATALRPGTQANRRSVLVKFIKFLSKFGTHFKQPSDEAVCVFFEKCLGSVRAPATIKNYTSLLSSAYRQMGLDSSVFEAFRVKNAMTSIDKNVRHVPSPSLPVSPALLKRVVKVVGRLPNGSAICAALILMFHSFLRQSNFTASTSTLFDPTRQITRGDINIQPDAVTIVLKWSKSHQLASMRSVVTIPAVPGSSLCPRMAVINLLRDVPFKHSQQPLICFKDGSHIPVYHIRKVWNTVLKVLEVPLASSYTLHGLRRGAATHVINTDPSAREDIKRHGMWRSDAVDTYLPSTSSKVFAVLRDTL